MKVLSYNSPEIENFQNMLRPISFSIVINEMENTQKISVVEMEFWEI